jgi:HSP20 family protein
MTTALAKKEPRVFRAFEPLQSIRGEFEGLWNRLMGERRLGWLDEPLAPAMDLTETANAFEVRMDLPGFDADNIDVHLGNNVLTVTGTRQDERKEDGVTCNCLERQCGNFARSFALPAPVREDEVDARFRNGVLSVALKKCDDNKSRKIKVQR